ncbi:beta-glucosidase [Dankookia sp. GCM10030260]|uniref:beta-glucosidase n=1 Tax=Dankookia sp. GCM10030260 TaxID=3273390 RepID=UPI0036131BD2
MSFRPSLFRSFFLGGFECSSHRRFDGRRLDLIAGTVHDLLAAEDYGQLREHGIATARDGLRWHMVERVPGEFDWRPVLPMLRAAEAAGVQVVWDLCHYGWPDGLDIWSAGFVDRFARYAAAFARLHLEETGRGPFVCPVNEISWFAWSGGDTGRINPNARGRGDELKRQLVRAAIAGTHAVREAAPSARIAAVDPIIRVAPQSSRSAARVEGYNEAVFASWDMLAGRLAPELGGSPDMLDVVGVNYYWNNQWVDHGEPLSPFDPRYRPLHALLTEVQARYGRPLFLAETSIEGAPRASWLRYVCDEVRMAMQQGTPVEGICLYPVISHQGWENDRHCPNGLFDMKPVNGRRQVHLPLAAELRAQQRIFGGG